MTVVQIQKSDLDTIEALIDRYSLSGVIEATAHIAHEKADHVRTNWQDKATASEWDKAATKLDKVASSIVL